MSTYRTGSHWGVTIVREAVGRSKYSPCRACESDAQDGHDCHPLDSDQLVAVVVNGDTALAGRICDLLNGERPALTCICNDPPPTVHGKNQPATRPPGWACPRHGMVL